MWKKIPEDLKIEILKRLPLKSLMRLKCVSKELSSLISSRDFCNSVFITTRQQQQPRLYLCLDGENGKRKLLSMSSPDKTCFMVDESIVGLGGFYLNVIHGLMCFSRRNNAIIYNPSTKQLLTLPDIKSDMIVEQGQRMHRKRFYLGHDPVTDQYKVFCTIVISKENDFMTYMGIVKSEHWVFVIKSGSSWKKLSRLGNYHLHAPVSLPQSTREGSVLHYMALLNTLDYVIVSFDIRSEEFTIIPVPNKSGGNYLYKADLIEYDGKVAILDRRLLRRRSLMNLWVLEDEIWSKKEIVLQSSQKLELVVKGKKVVLAPVEINKKAIYLEI